MDDTILSVTGLKKHFGEIKAVDDISFSVKQGELFGFLGVNGAGKSTTINMLCTILKPTAGEAKICGLKLGQEDEKIRARIGVVYQQNCLDERLSVKENLFLWGALYDKGIRTSGCLSERIARVCEILELSDVYHRRYAKLSGGQKRRCEIARALIHTPSILFLDEPTTGLDPATRQNVWACLETLRKEEQMTVFLTTHYMEEAARASHIAIMDAGKLCEFGTPFSLKETYAKDRLRLIPKTDRLAEIEEYLDKCNERYRKTEEGLEISLSDSMTALPILDSLRESLTGFEVIQGSMDDVFLNVTGKALTEAAGDGQTEKEERKYA